MLCQLQQTYEAADTELKEVKLELEIKKVEYETTKDKMLLILQKFTAVQSNYHTQRFAIVRSQNTSLLSQKNVLLSQLKSVKSS